MDKQKPMSSYRQSLRGRILETAMQAFAQKGIKAVKMDYIAQTLGISKRTLYELYENKELLLLEGVKNYHKRKEQEMDTIAAQEHNVMDIILHIYRMRIEEFHSTSPQFYSDIVMYPAVLDYFHKNKERSNQRFVDFLKRGISEGYFRSDVDMELIVMMFTAMTDYIMQNQLYQRYSIEHIIRNFLLVALRGFCTPEGVKAFDRHFMQTS